MGQSFAADRLIVGVGYLGTQVATLWRGAGARVFGTTRKPDRFETLANLGIEPVQWNTAAPTGDRSLPRAETVLYCVGYDRAGSQGIREACVTGLQRTLARLSGVREIVYISTTGVYGDHGGEWIDESTTPAPIDESGSAHLEAESVLLDWARGQGARATILRLAGIYGPGRAIGAATLAAGRPIEADPDVYLNLIQVEDAACAIEAARVRGKGGGGGDGAEIYIVADGQPPTRRAFYEYLASLLGAPAPTFQPEGARRRRGDRRFSARKLRAELGFSPRFPDYRAGLAACFSTGPGPN